MGRGYASTPFRKETKKSFADKKFKDILTQEKELWENNNIIIEEDGTAYLNQIELIIWTYKKQGIPQQPDGAPDCTPYRYAST